MVPAGPLKDVMDTVVREGTSNVMPAAGLGDLVPRKVDGRVLFRQPAGARVAGGEELEEVEHPSVFDEFGTHKGSPREQGACGDAEQGVSTSTKSIKLTARWFGNVCRVFRLACCQ